mmetsp:Transcript_38619/g.36973  ORF Transcript_38619/g.36973 Transcript_38619/m.36973 type:complete len:166 (+) Transcript_38619:109-606(+)
MSYVPTNQKLTLNLIKYNEMLQNIISERRRNLSRGDRSMRNTSLHLKRKESGSAQSYASSHQSNFKSKGTSPTKRGQKHPYIPKDKTPLPENMKNIVKTTQITLKKKKTEQFQHSLSMSKTEKDNHLDHQYTNGMLMVNKRHTDAVKALDKQRKEYNLQTTKKVS